MNTPKDWSPDTETSREESSLDSESEGSTLDDSSDFSDNIRYCHLRFHCKDNKFGRHLKLKT